MPSAESPLAAASPAAQPVAGEDDDSRKLPPLLWIGLAAAAVVVALAAAIFALSGDSDDGTSTAGTSPTVGASVAPSGAAPGTQPSESAAATPGVVASAAVITGDLVSVSEEVTWSDGGPGEITLALPDLEQVGGLPTGFDPQVQSLVVTVDGTPAQPEAGDQPNTWVVRPAAGPAPQTMKLSYVLAGAVTRSTPSQAGRALAVVAPLSQGAVGDLPVEVKVTGAGVLSLVCPGAPGTSPALCGRHAGDVWSAQAPSGSPAVALVQLDLAPPA